MSASWVALALMILFIAVAFCWDFYMGHDVSDYARGAVAVVLFFVFAVFVYLVRQSR